MKRALKIITWVLFLIFIVEGGSKLLGTSFQVNGFTQWGYSLRFMYIIGALETLGAIGIIIRPLSLLANIGLLGIMIGAFYTHISKGDPIVMMSLAVVATALLLLRLLLIRRIRKSRELTYSPDL
jgi:putative oxidoreductase